VIKYDVPQVKDGSLPTEALEIIDQCDSVFITARHLASTPSEVDDMDANHRGGKPGTPNDTPSDPRLRPSRGGWKNAHFTRL